MINKGFHIKQLLLFFFLLVFGTVFSQDVNHKLTVLKIHLTKYLEKKELK